MSSEAEHSTLVVELDLVTDSEPIRGRVRDTDGKEHAFRGWLELMQMLERVRVRRGPGASAKKAGTREQG